MTTAQARLEQSDVRESDNSNQWRGGSQLFNQVAQDINSQQNSARVAEQSEELAGKNVLPFLHLGTDKIGQEIKPPIPKTPDATPGEAHKGEHVGAGGNFKGGGDVDLKKFKPNNAICDTNVVLPYTELCY